MICGLYRVRCFQVQDPRLSGTSHVPRSMSRHRRLCLSALDAPTRRAGHVVTKRQRSSGKPTTSPTVQWWSTICSALLPCRKGTCSTGERSALHSSVRAKMRTYCYSALCSVLCGLPLFSCAWIGSDACHSWEKTHADEHRAGSTTIFYWRQFFCAACASQVHQMHESRAHTPHDCAQPASIPALDHPEWRHLQKAE